MQLGIAIVNDFKSVEGDRALGLQSLPVAFGTETAKWICVGAIDITQLSVAGMYYPLFLCSCGFYFFSLILSTGYSPMVKHKLMKLNQQRQNIKVHSNEMS